MTLPLFFSAINGSAADTNTETGTTRSFLSLLTTEKKRLYNYILKSLNYHEDAKDIYQEAVLRAFRYFGKFDPLKEFGPWIFTIASNEIKRYFKNRLSVGPIYSLEKIYEQIPEQNNKELAEAVFSFAFSLNTIEREIFFLFYDSGFSVSEISEIAGKNGGNIKVILSNSRKKIRSLLGDINEK